MIERNCCEKSSVKTCLQLLEVFVCNLLPLWYAVPVELVPSGVEFEEGGTKKKGDNTVRICYSIADNTRKQIGRNCHHEYSIPQEFRERQGSNWVN